MIFKKINNINPEKAMTNNSIPPKILKNPKMLKRVSGRILHSYLTTQD